METIAASAVVATLLLEVIKYLIRRAYGNPQFDFPSKFYVVAIPVLNVAVVPLLALIGFEGYTVPTDWQGWALSIIRVAISSLATLVGYSTGLKPLKEYARSAK